MQKTTKYKNKSKILFAKIKENRILDDQNNFLGQIDKDFIYIFSKKRKEFFAVKHMKQ